MPDIASMPCSSRARSSSVMPVFLRMPSVARKMFCVFVYLPALHTNIEEGIFAIVALSLRCHICNPIASEVWRAFECNVTRCEVVGSKLLTVCLDAPGRWKQTSASLPWHDERQEQHNGDHSSYINHQLDIKESCQQELHHLTRHSRVLGTGVLVGHPKWMNVARSIYDQVDATLNLPAFARQSRIHLPNRRTSSLIVIFVRRTITTPIPCSLSKDPLSYPPTLYPPNALPESRLFRNQSSSSSVICRKGQVQSCRAMICFSCSVEKRQPAAE